jgi:hypothetical protein
MELYPTKASFTVMGKPWSGHQHSLFAVSFIDCFGPSHGPFHIHLNHSIDLGIDLFNVVQMFRQNFNR